MFFRGGISLGGWKIEEAFLFFEEIRNQKWERTWKRIYEGREVEIIDVVGWILKSEIFLSEGIVSPRNSADNSLIFLL